MSHIEVMAYMTQVGLLCMGLLYPDMTHVEVELYRYDYIKIGQMVLECCVGLKMNAFRASVIRLRKYSKFRYKSLG